MEYYGKIYYMKTNNYCWEVCYTVTGDLNALKKVYTIIINTFTFKWWQYLTYECPDAEYKRAYDIFRFKEPDGKLQLDLQKDEQQKGWTVAPYKVCSVY